MALEIVIPPGEIFDEKTGMFTTWDRPVTLILEHSLLSISKWEAKWHKPFLDKTPKTNDELYDYFRCMTINKETDPLVYRRLTPAMIKQINEYIDDPMTATKFSHLERKQVRKVTTSEEIYYSMFANQVPISCEKWHINRLITLLTICGIHNAPPKKMSKSEIMSRNAALNAKRRAALHSKG